MARNAACVNGPLRLGLQTATNGRAWRRPWPIKRDVLSALCLLDQVEQSSRLQTSLLAHSFGPGVRPLLETVDVVEERPSRT